MELPNVLTATAMLGSVISAVAGAAYYVGRKIAGLEGILKVHATQHQNLDKTVSLHEKRIGKLEMRTNPFRIAQ